MGKWFTVGELSGEERVQEKDGAEENVKKGDSLTCPPASAGPHRKLCSLTAPHSLLCLEARDLPFVLLLQQSVMTLGCLEVMG